MSFLTADLALVHDHQRRLHAEAAAWRLVRRRPDRERTPVRSATQLVPRVDHVAGAPERERSAPDSSSPSAA
jgi:hypothetical protein